MWGCEDVDQQMCRSAGVRVWRCSMTAAFLRRTLRRRPREKNNIMSRQRSFTSVQTFHTDTRVSLQMMWRWGWKGDEDEMRVKLRWKITQHGDEEGKAKEEGKSKHQHQHTWPGAGKPWNGKEIEKRRPTDTEQDQRRVGKTEAPEPT